MSLNKKIILNFSIGILKIFVNIYLKKHNFRKGW